jgi:DNA polymerase-3 subunit gamma/tau
VSLYHKHRPKTFEDMLGNEATIEALRLAFSKEEKPHAVCFSGPSGCGKTTLARMVAQTYLGAGEFSIREINSSDTRGIETAREIIEQIRYTSPDGKPIVYIIDECHKATADWQNAMLKPLEDTPEHVYFFLCTTDPNKLLKTIHTRCFQARVTLQKTESLYKLIRKVAKAEGLEQDKEIYQMVADNSDGSPRQALVLLDTIAEMEDMDEIEKVLEAGAISEQTVIDLCRALLKPRSWGDISSVLKAMTESDPERIRYAVLSYMNKVLLGSHNPVAGLVMECFSENTYNTGMAGITIMCYQSFDLSK